MTPNFTIEHKSLAGYPAVFLTIEAELDMNAELKRIILNEEIDIRQTLPSDPVAGLSDGLTTHWQHYNVLRWPYDVCGILRDAIVKGCQAWTKRNCKTGSDYDVIAISCWANAFRGKEHLKVHNHSPALILGNYIVDNAQGTAGTLYFSEDGQVERLAPEPGRLVICSGEVRHAVEPHKQSQPRLSIAFDAFVKSQNPLLYLGYPDAMQKFSGPRWLTFV